MEECNIDTESHSYFGRMSNDQPKVGVIYSMLDEHVQKIVEKRGQDFHKELNKTLKEFKRSIKDDLEQNRKSVCYQRADVKAVQQKSIEQEKEIKRLKAYISKLLGRPNDINDEIEIAEIKASLIRKGVIKEN